MTIKVGSQIQKLDPNDNYKIVDWADVVDSANIAQNIADLRTSQNNLAVAVANKTSGIAVTDKLNRAVNSATSVVFDNAVITVDPLDPKKIHVILDTGSGNSLTVKDGTGAASNVTEFIFDGADVTSSNGVVQIHTPFKQFSTIAERDTWKNKYVSVLKYDVVVVVDKDEDNKIHWYKYDAATRTFLDYTVAAPTGGSSGTLTIADQQLSVGSANKLEFTQGKILEDGNGGVTYTPYVSVGNMAGNYTAYTGKLINLLPPLMAEQSRSGPNTITEDEVSLMIDPSAYQPLNAPSFLAYVKEDTEIVGKGNHLAKGHHDGALWFDDIIVSAGPFIELRQSTKSYGIQEADKLDPNITGGTKYLLIFRIHVKGKALDDGSIKLYMYNTSQDPFDPVGYLTDVNGQPMIVEKQYKAGDEFGVLQLSGIVSATGLQEFSCHVIDTFADENLVITDRTEGASGLLIQALTPTSKSGDALQQFELDTQQNIEVSSHFLGAYRTTLNWVTSADQPVIVGKAGTGTTMSDGFSLYNITDIKMGVMDGHVHIEDNNNICDYHFGRIFSAEETKMLRGHTIDVTVTLIDKDQAFTVAMVKWSGKPDEYTDHIFSKRNNNSPIYDTNWSLAGSLAISEDPITGDHTLAKTFTVPTDAVNYGIVIFPVEAAQPSLLKLKELRVNVNPVINGYIIKEPTILGEVHLTNSVQYKSLVQNTQGYNALRYTINDTEIPMPIGEIGNGLADITLDTSVNTISGSMAKGGEGGIRFAAEGEATIKTDLLLWSEKAPQQSSNVQFWYAVVDRTDPSNIVYKPIEASRTQFTIQGNSSSVQVSMKPFAVNVLAGDVLVLRAQGSSQDSVFLQCKRDDFPLLKTSITFKELQDTGYDDPFSGIDLTQFTSTFTSGLTVVKDVANVASVVIPFDIPNDMNVVVLSAIKELADTSIRPVTKLDWIYNNVTKSLTISFGETVLVGRVTIGIYV